MKAMFYNGVVYTGDCIVDTFIVEDNHFLFVGHYHDALKFMSEDDCFIDLNNKFVCSGFNDSHMHLLNYGSSLMNAQLTEYTDSLEKLCHYLKRFIVEKGLKEEEWVLGRGWNHDYFTDVNRMPNRFDLDNVSTSHPICITRVCGHCLVVNSKALECIGIDVNDENIDINMRNGIFYDDYLQKVYRAIPIPCKEDLKNMLRAASQSLNSYGVTSCQSDDYCTFRSISWEDINEAYKELVEENELTVRVNEQANLTCLNDLKEFYSQCYENDTGDTMFKIGPLKILGDGSLGARTAFLSENYRNDPTTRGMLCYDEKVIEDMICFANEKGMQIAVHAIGDQCLDVVLNAYEKALKQLPRDNHRHGIVHCQISRDDQLKRIKELELSVYVQTIFLDYDIRIVYDCVSAQLASTSYSWKTLLDSGVYVSNGTDCPVELPDPLRAIQCAITRKTLDGVGPYLENQSFTIKEAIDSYTKASAYVSFEENIKGYIREKYLADFVVLDKNLFDIDVNCVKDVRVLETYLDGKCVFRKMD